MRMVLAWKKVHRSLDVDVVGDRRGLRALAERLGKRQKQRQHRNQQRDLLVAAMRRVLGVFGMLQILVCAHRPLPRVTWCTRAASHMKCKVRARSVSRARMGAGDKLRVNARYRPPYRSAWSTARRGRAVPGWRAGRRRAPAGAWRRNGAARAASRCRAGRARRAAVPSPVARCAATAARRARRRTAGRRPADRAGRARHSRRSVCDLRQHRHHARLVALAGDGDGVALRRRRNVLARKPSASEMRSPEP